MIAACPKCAARYRIDRAKLGEGGARLRCSRCESVFRVRAPAEKSAAAPAAPTQEQAPAEKPRVQVLVAMPDADLAKRTAAALEARGLHSAVVFDGVDAMLEIQRQQPAVVVLAADLPKMFGFQVCEIVKRNESLCGTQVVLAGAVHHPERYRRSPTELYGADFYVEVPDLPDGLFPLLEEAGILAPIPATGGSPKPSSPMPSRREPAVLPEADPPARRPQEGAAPVSPAPGPKAVATPEPRRSEPVQPSPQPQQVAQPVQPPVPSPTAVPSEELAQAERLARIIVSDIVLYNEEKFASAVQAGDVSEAMASELDEGRGLFERRIDAQVRGKTDFLMEELMRVAHARGMS